MDGIYISTNGDDFGGIILFMTKVIDHPYKKTCPKCKSGDVIRIVYGYPDTPEVTIMPKDSEPEIEDPEPEIELGGCVVRGDDPHLKCKTCGYRWDRYDGL